MALAALFVLVAVASVADADAVFAALADPTRRGILLGSPAGAPARRASSPHLPISRQAVSKHLAALAEAGLVESERNGRETRYRPTPAPLDEAAAWMAEVGTLWDARLAALARFVDTGPTRRRTQRNQNARAARM